MRYRYNLDAGDFTKGMMVEVEIGSVGGPVWIAGTVEEVSHGRVLVLRKDGRYRAAEEPKKLRAIVQ